ARRWIARIMITWGLLAAGMMFVRTPAAFYALRFLLGVAEAGFFPGVMFYLAQWFPLAHRGRAVSRFYAATPLASVVMGGVSGWLLDLDGVAKLHGWQWLFLAQGLPAAIIGLLVLWRLPDGPAVARWLTVDEKAWIGRELQRDAARIGEPADHSVMAALRNPIVWQLGAIGFLTLSANLAFILSAPVLLSAATGLDVRRVGYLVSLGGVLGALSILGGGWLSDRLGERFRPAIAGSLVLAGAFVTLVLFQSPAVVIAAYLVFAATCFTTQMLEASIWPDVLHLRELAVAGAAINSLANVGGFLAPYAWGAARDATGSYRAGLMALPFVYVAAALALLALRRQVQARTARMGEVAVAALNP
ncbi:MAG TPA: MFS transporter, partial [Phenylobacterium sp.]|nr:MFS transporter [Phenylobacterium sp.]